MARTFTRRQHIPERDWSTVKPSSTEKPYPTMKPLSTEKPYPNAEPANHNIGIRKHSPEWPNYGRRDQHDDTGSSTTKHFAQTEWPVSGNPCQSKKFDCVSQADNGVSCSSAAHETTRRAAFIAAPSKVAMDFM